jgi:anti-sigma B factor antagonist
MPLELQDRQLGRVVVVKAAGRVVAGAEAQQLESRVNQLSAGCRDLVLDVAGVSFVDSSGLGTLVRLLSRIRRSGGDLKLCSPPAAVQRLLAITNMLQVFDVHESELAAVSAFYARTRAAEDKPEACARRLLCIHPSVDTLMYLRELLRRSGYDAITTSNVPDAIVLLKATAPALVVLAEEVQSARGRGTVAMLQQVRPDVPVVLLRPEFSSQEAGEAGGWLLQMVRAELGKAAAS